ncbi:MAG: glycosyltransferase family 4 protein [Syntrophorhabdaceae bacterium]
MKPIVLVLTGHYLPGYKAGGILHNLVNTVNSLGDELDFRIITRDRDLGDRNAYTGITVNEWRQSGNAMVYYMPSDKVTLGALREVISETRHDMLYLTSLFDALTVKTLFLRKKGRIVFKPVIVEPNGEFGWASFKQKYLKKISFIKAAGTYGLYRDVIWRAASYLERDDIVRYMKIPADRVHVAAYVPEDIEIEGPSGECFPEKATDNGSGLKIVFISRIAPEKNLDYALKVLSHVTVPVIFDIFGPKENERYWKKCEDLINSLPSNITVNYFGRLEHHEVKKVFGCYDMFFFPSAGEAYGMVIAESLATGTPVLTSDKTAWSNLEEDNLGWDFPLNDVDSFVKTIEKYSRLTGAERLSGRSSVKSGVVKRLFDPAIKEQNRSLFFRLIS